MTRSDLMTLALAIVNTSGRAFVTTSVEQNKVCNRMTMSYAEITRCLYDDRVPFTLTIGTGVYDIRNIATSPFTKRFSEIRQLTINGAMLLDPRANEPGPITLPYLEKTVNPNYQTVANSLPYLWLRLDRTHIRLYPAPDAVYANNFASGYTLPADIDTSAGGDAAVIEIPDEHVNDLATWIAAGLMFPNNATETDFNRMQQLNAAASTRMQAMQEESKMVSPLRYRGATKDTPTRNLY